MRWPWSKKRLPSSERLIVSWSGQVLSYLQAQAGSDGRYVVTRTGVLRQAGDSLQEFYTRVQALGLRGDELHVMLRPEQYQLLQIEMPAVPPEELRAAARYQIREMVDAHLDDLTIDVMRVGAGEHKSAGQLFVVVSPNAVLREMADLAHALHWQLAVIDIQDTAQRNLQSAMARRLGLGDLAKAALIVISNERALLTISAHGELYYSRRLELPQGFMQLQWEDEEGNGAAAASEYVPVAPYEPDYSGSTSYDYSAPLAIAQAAAHGQPDNERSQRFLVEVQRSLDLWDRNWGELPLSGLRVHAGERSADLAHWLSHETGVPVGILDLDADLMALRDLSQADQMACLPLLGILMRSQPNFM